MKIHTKFLLTMLLLGTALMSGIILLFQNIVIPWQTDTMVQSSREVGYYLQNTIPMLANDQKQEFVSNIHRDHKDLSYIVILDKNGKALYHSNPHRVGMIFNDEGTLSATRYEKEIQQIYTRDETNPDSVFHGERTIDILIPYYDLNRHYMGTVNVGLSLETIEEMKKQYYAVIAIIGLILFGILLFITYEHSHSVLLPLTRLSLVAKRLGDGNISQYIAPKRNDEIGLLTQEFNSMAEKLENLINDLKLKEQDLQNYIDNLITLNAKLALDGSLLMINKNAATFINIQVETLIGKKFWETPWWNYDTHVQEKLMAAVEQAAAGQTVYYETENYFGPNRYVVIDFTLNPVLNEKNEVIYLVAEGRDITPRKQMEQELVAANQELVATNEELISIEEELRGTNEELSRAHQKVSNILESITDAFYAVNQKWEITYVNAEAEKLLQKQRIEIIGKNLWEGFPQVVNTSFFQQLNNVLKEQKPATFEYHYEPLSKWFDIHAYPSSDGLSIYFHDITSTKLAQEKMALQNLYLTALHETALSLMNRLELDDLLEAIVTRAGALLGTNQGFLYLVTDNKAEIELKLGLGSNKKAIGTKLKPGEGLSGKVWQSGEPITINNYSTWVGRSSKFNHIEAYSAVAAPLKSDQQVVGVIGLSHISKNRTFSEDDLMLLKGFAQLASIALDNAQLYNAAQQELVERKRVEEIMKHMAYHDSLTELPNRALFNDRLQVALAQAKRNQKMLAVMFLDLDYFKVVNDTLGHDMGDQLLKGIANRLSSLLRKGDTVARIGGDEFTILLHEISKAEDAGTIAQKIINALREPWVLAQHEFHITTSIGITLYPANGEDVETLVKNADSAMYQAKERGRNNFQFYTPDMNARALHRLELENNLRKALDRNEFVIHYQPQIDINTGQIKGTEALVRWNHSQWGLISPAQFIPIAEDTGLIISIGEWVLRTACKQNKTWQEAGYPPIRVAVNLSARQFQQHNLVQKVAQILKETGLDPRWLELEITETVTMKDVKFTGKMLFELRKMGITVTIDDFGTGYSSLNYLKRLPIDIIKIDRSFIRDITIDPDDASIVSTIIVLAHNLKMKVTAEGVETSEQLNFLKQQQCDKMQGYLFSKPVPAEKLERLLIPSTTG